jgi:hypothetical protein
MTLVKISIVFMGAACLLAFAAGLITAAVLAAVAGRKTDGEGGPEEHHEGKTGRG